MVYIGVDLHRKKSQVAAIDQDGNLLFNRKVSTGPPAMQQVIDELRPRAIEVAFEATYGWGWFADLLADAGIAVVRHVAGQEDEAAVDDRRREAGAGINSIDGHGSTLQLRALDSGSVLVAALG